MTDFVPDSVWIYAGSDGGWTDTGEWSCDVEPDCAHYWPHVKMLTATPVRLHAEELVALLKEALEELDEYYRAEYDTDHPYHKDKLARARDSWAHARDLLARIEGDQP